LEVLPRTHISRAAIDAKADGTLNALIVMNESRAGHTVSVELSGMKGNRLDAQIKEELEKGTTEKMISGNFSEIIPWNPELPTLYQVKISLYRGSELLHEVTERIGFRTVELRRHDGFYVNGEKVVFKGVNRHSFWPETGRCL